MGNANYVSVPALSNGNDSAALAETLRLPSFDVSLVRNVDKPTFEEKIREFADFAANAEAAVFFYAGHGLQVVGWNCMGPVDAKIADEADLPFHLVAVEVVSAVALKPPAAAYSAMAVPGGQAVGFDL